MDKTRFFFNLLLNKVSITFVILLLSINAVSETFQLGDLAPRGSPDGQLNAADSLILERIILGDILPTSDELLIGDVAPLGVPDGQLNSGDLVVQQRAILGLISLGTVSTLPPVPLAPTINSPISPTNINPYLITGNSEPGSIVSVYVNNLLQVTTTADILVGDFSVFITLDEGENIIYATSVNAGGVSPKSSDVLVHFQLQDGGTLSGVIAADFTLFKNTVYTISSNLTVQSGANLVVEHGARIKFDTGAGLFINGRLTVAGVEKNRTVFTSNEIIGNQWQNDWPGITVENGGIVNIEHSLIEYAFLGVQFNEGGGGVIANSVIDTNTYGVFLNHGSGAIVADSIIRNNGIGVYVLGSTTAYIGPNNDITQNDTGVYFKPHYDYVNYISTDPSAVIRDNRIFDNNINILSRYFENDRYTLLDLQGNYWGGVDVNEIVLSTFNPTANYYPAIYPDSYPVYDVRGYLDENGNEYLHPDQMLLGVITQDTTLIKDQTYIALSVLEVAQGVTLTIPEGVTIKFVSSSTVGLDVKGTLNVIGAEGNPVILTSNMSNGERMRSDWQGVTVDSGGIVNISYSLIEYASNGIYFSYGSNGIVDNSIIQNNDSGIYFHSTSAVVVTGTRLENNTNGIYFYWEAAPVIGPDNVITNNTSGLYLESFGTDFPVPSVSGNKIFGNIKNNIEAKQYPLDDHVMSLQGNYWGSVDITEILLNMESWSVSGYSVIYDVVTYDVSGYLDENGVADTAIPLIGIIDIDTTLNADSSYLIVGNDLKVSSGITLTIPEGVILEFPLQDSWLTVNGSLVVSGASDNLVIFTSAKASEDKSIYDWKGVVIEDGGVVIIDHALIEYALYGVRFVAGSSGTVINSKIINNNTGVAAFGDGINESKNPTPIVNDNSIYDNLNNNYFTSSYVGADNTVLDATNNWWGTTDAFSIQLKISDWNDNALNKVIVDSSSFLDSEGGRVYVKHELLNCPIVHIDDDADFIDDYPDNDIDWIGNNLIDVIEIERAFNNARLIDDSVIQYLKMPTQVEWNAMPVQMKGLYLINSERQARGIKPYEGINQNVVTVAQNYSDFLLNNNQVIGHYNDGKSPAERLNDDPVIRDNSDAIRKLESIYGLSGSVTYVNGTEAIVDAIYRWVYVDKSAGNNWGHRDQILQTGLNENSGETFKEGLIGFGISIGYYDPAQNPPTKFGAVVVLNSIDPSPTWDHNATEVVDTDIAQQCNSNISINIDEALAPVAQIKSLEILPTDIYLTPGATSQLQVIATLQDNTKQDITAAASFIADNLSIVDIDAGRITAQRNGFVYASASANGVTSNKVFITVNDSADTSNLNNTFAENYLAYVPTNSSLEKYDPLSFGIFTGFVKDESDDPLSDVMVSIHNKPEFGSVKTDINGRFIFAVEAGDKRFVYRKPGYLTIHRSAISSSNAWAVVDDVKMMDVDTSETSISLGTATPQTHKSTTVTDQFGSRSTTLVFNGITTATVTSSDGSQRSLSDFVVRATEYEFPQSMPAELPEESAFTYCSELQVTGVRDDENIIFDNNVVMYVDNFLGFNVGEIVPIGYYDRQIGEWVASDNGIVVKLLDTNGDTVVDGLDISGDLIPDDLNQNGTTDDEVVGLEAYPVGATYWRGEFNHFTPYDYNWPYKPVTGAVGRGEFIAETSGEDKSQKELECTGSYVKPETQSFHEDIEIAGTDLTVHYSSQRTAGYKHKFNVKVSGDSISPNMLEMQVKLAIGGNFFEQTFVPEINKEAEFVWDGNDPTGKRIDGVVQGTISIGFKYGVEYVSAGAVNNQAEYESYARAWAQVGGADSIGPGRDDLIVWSNRTVIAQNTYDNQLAEGWSISNHHVKTSAGKIYQGDGEVIDTGRESLILKTGITASRYIGDDGYYQKGGSEINYSITNSGTLLDTVTGLEWQYTKTPRRFKDIIAASQYCVVASFATDKDGWRLPTYKEIVYAVDKTGNDHAVEIYELSSLDNIWHASNNNPGNKFLPVYCVKGDTLNQRYIADLKRNDAAEVVIDEFNNLMWMDDGSATATKRSWRNSLNYCEASTHAGYEDWRLPNINELAYTLPNTVFQNQTTFTDPDGTWGPTSPSRNPYWSSTPYEGFANKAWAMESIGFTSPVFNVLDFYYTRCVRDNSQFVQSPYKFDTNGRHLKTVDLNTGVTLQAFGYDVDGALRTITDRFGDTLTISGIPEVDGYYQITSEDGYKTTVNIDADNNVSSIKYNNNTDYSFTYIEGGLLTSKIEPNGNIFNHTFNTADGRVIQTTDQEGGIWNFFSTRQGNQSALYGYTTAELNTYQTLRTILDNGDTNKTTTLFDGTILTDLNQADDLKQTLQSCTATTVIDKVIDRKTKQPIPSAITIAQPSGLQSITTINKTYGANGADVTKQTITTAQNGKASSVFINSKTGVTTITSAENRTTTLNSAPDTLLLQSTQTPGLVDTSYTYDARGRQKTITTGTRTTSFTYGVAGKGDITTITADDGKQTHFEYDPLGRVAAIIYPDAHRLENSYDDKGNLIQRVIPTPANHDFSFNKINKVKNQTRPKDGLISEVTQYQYDTERNLTRITLPSTKVINHSYVKGLLDQTVTPDGTINYSYTCNEKIDAIAEGTEGINYGYDGSLLTDISYSGELNETLSYGYNTDFNITSLNYAGIIASYTYDDDGLLTSANGYTITRNIQNGLPESVSNAALDKTRSYNGYGEIETVTTKVNNNTIYGYTLGYNDVGKITTKTETLDNGTVNTYIYTYDDRHRLDTVKLNNVLVEDYNYDKNGNRTNQTNDLRGINKQSATYNIGDQLSSDGTTAYDYDADGYLKEKVTVAGTTKYQYDTQGRLKQVVTPTNTISYRHNALGNRVVKLLDGTVTEKYLWLDKTTLLATYDENNNLKQRFHYTDSNTPDSYIQNGQTYYIVTDHLGSPRAITDDSGAVLRKISYDSFGNIITDTAPNIEIPFGFAGGLYDKDTEFVRFGFRDYDPVTGRWTARDPIGFSGGDTNLYGYVFNDPINFFDQNGLFIVNPVTVNVALAVISTVATTIAIYNAKQKIDKLFKGYEQDRDRMSNVENYANELQNAQAGMSGKIGEIHKDLNPISQIPYPGSNIFGLPGNVETIHEAIQGKCDEK